LKREGDSGRYPERIEISSAANWKDLLPGIVEVEIYFHLGMNVAVPGRNISMIF